MKRVGCFSGLGVGLFGLSTPRALASGNVSLSLVPFGGTTVESGDLVDFEVFITVDNTEQGFRGGQQQLPCTLPGGSGGTVTTGNADGDPLSTIVVNVGGEHRGHSVRVSWCAKFGEFEFLPRWYGDFCGE
jgi:hypothetical protein